MALSKNDALPFKTMDIKAAFQNGQLQNRKRKSSTEAVNADSKVQRLSNDDSMVKTGISCEADVKQTDSDIEVINSDCKENADSNVATKPPIQTAENSDKESKPNCSEVEIQIEKPEEKSSTSSNSSSDSEQNTSGVNSSLNTTLNVTETSACDVENVQNSPGKSDNNPEIINEVPQGDNQLLKPKRKRKMTPEEAKKRAEEREKKQNERDNKKKELAEKKEQKRLEKEQRKCEREHKMRMKKLVKEREELEKQERERLRQEKKEQDEKEKQQRQEQKLKEKELKQQIKETVVQQKIEKKKMKEELKQKREEELKRSEEEKKEKEQKEKERQERAKAAFVKFFIKPNSGTPKTPQLSEKEGVFKPFQVSDDMTVAPVVPKLAKERFNKENLDHCFQNQECQELYLQSLKSRSYEAVRQKKREKKPKLCDADVITVDKNEQAGIGLSAKLLQFSENVRPPYWGSWRKKSKNIRPRNPFGQDEIFDYTVDSDDEWDEGGPGESLSGTEPEDESEDDYEVDNEFFVPHGYLSAEEEKEEDEVANDPEEQKAMLKIKLQEFEKERKRKTTELKPIILGCHFENDPQLKDNGLQKLLVIYKAEFLTESPIPTRYTVAKQQADSRMTTPNTAESSPVSEGSAKVGPKRPVPEEAMPYLIRLLHGNIHSRQTVVKEFQEFWLQHSRKNVSNETEAMDTSQTDTSPVSTDATPKTPQRLSNSISKRQLDLMINKISSYGKCPSPALKKFCWWVKEEVLQKYGLQDVPIPNQWKYVSRKREKDADDLACPPAKLNIPSIKDFLNL